MASRIYSGPMLQPTTHPTGLMTLQSPQLAACRVPHGFTTRLGSEDLTGHRLGAAIDCAAHTLVTVRQVHGRNVHVVTADPHNAAIDADAVMTDQPGMLVAVRVADCVPVLIAARNGMAVAAIHAGWRGLVAEIIAHAVLAMRDHYNLAGADLVAAVGPAISAKHYQVSHDLAAAFAERGLADAIEKHPGARPHINLPLAARLQLQHAGLTAIDTTDECTFAHRQWFFSHRRDPGVTGRQAAVIGVALFP